MASSAIKQTVSIQSITAQTGSSLYDGYYYVDIAVPNTERIIGMTALTQGNRATILQIVNSTTIRAYVDAATMTVTVRIATV